MSTPPAGPRWHWNSAFAGALIAALAAGGVLLALSRPDPPPIVVHPPPSPTPPAVTLPVPTATPAPLVVFVSGAVQTPGLYQLPAGARVGDALAAAGGLTAAADPAAVNQATPLHDGDQVHVPAAAEAAPTPPPGVSGTGTSAGTPQDTPADTPAGPIDVNTATQAELESLPGIGPSLAQAIIANRPYATVDELDRVPGIGPATLEKIRPYVVVP